MYSTSQRLQNTTSWATSICLLFLAAISVTSWLTIPKLEMGNIAVKSFQVVPGSGRDAEKEFAMIRFDLSANLQPLFDAWNTKQVYVSVVASWNGTSDASENSVVLWDRIITRKRAGAPRLRLEGVRAKNTWKVKKGAFKQIPHAHLTLQYDLMPYVGIVTPGIAGRARNPEYKNGSAVGEWDVAVPGVKSGGVGS